LKRSSLKPERIINTNRLPAMYRIDPESVKYSMFEQARDSVGPYGEDRIAYIKKQFKQIFENILPWEFQC